MPRLSKADKIKFYKLCHSYALSDIRHPDIYGFGPAGLLEMTVRRRYMPLLKKNKIDIISKLVSKLKMAKKLHL